MSFTSFPDWDSPFIDIQFKNQGFYAFTCRYAYKDSSSFMSYLNSLPGNDLMEAWESGYYLSDLVSQDDFQDVLDGVFGMTLITHGPYESSEYKRGCPYTEF